MCWILATNKIPHMFLLCIMYFFGGGDWRITNSNNSGAYAQNNGNIINNGTIKSIGIGTNAIISGTSGIVTNNGIIEKSNNE